MENVNNLVSLIITLVGKFMTWVDNLFSIFTGYSGKYANLIMYGVLIFLLSKMLKLKVNIGK